MRSKSTVGLRQIRDLRRAAHLRRSPEQKILKHRPQQRRRRNALRLGIENAQQIRRRIALVSLRTGGQPQAVRLLGRGRDALERQPRARFLVDQKQQARLRRDQNLRVIAGGLESLAALDQRGMELIGAFDSRAQHRRAQAVEISAGGIDNQQPLRRKNLCVKLRERPRQKCGRACRPRRGRPSHPRAEQFRRPLGERRDRLVEDDPARGQGGCGLRIVGQRRQLAAGGKCQPG